MTDLTAALTEALASEPYILADTICEHDGMFTGISTPTGFVVSCASCKARAGRSAATLAKHLAPLVEAREREAAARAEFPLSLAETQEIVGFLMERGGREGLILANGLNVAMGASARRRRERARAEEVRAGGE